jgi:PAS domain S-box-containing protein
VPRFSSDGAFLGYVGSCIDVTDQRAAQQAVRASEEQLRLATEAAEVGLWDVDVVTDTLFWPPRVKAMFGISPNVQVSMDDFYAGLHPEEREATSAAFAAAVDPARRALYDVEYRTVGKEDGLVRWVAAKGRGIFDGDGRCVRVIGTAIDITPRKLAEARLREREEHLRAVVETSPECVKLVARDGTLLQMNTSGLALLGAAHEGLVVGKSIYDLIAPEHRDAFRAFNERICDGDRDVLEFDVIGLTGERRHMETHAAPLRMPDGACVQLAMTRDVTARREAEAALRESDRRKDEFIATLSHELRNPLAPLSNALEILRLSTDHADHARIREMMERQVNHLVRLVDDLLEVSRINHGALELRRERVDLATVVRNAAEASEPLIRDARHELDITLPDEPVWLDGDPVRLAQILANLLNNAARYMAPGGRISVAGGVSGDAVAVSVRDHGVGFAPDAASHLFEMFGRGAHSSGLGIGLALARRLAEMHGGTIAAASEGPGRGAEFTLTLPHANAPADADARGAPASAPQRQQRILVVDDNEDAADSTRMILELLGADVRAVHAGRDALAAFDAWHPDVVLLDIGMPGMDGYAVARALRAKARGDEAFIVAVSGWGQARDRHQSREAGFDDHLVKPADFRALGQLLDDLQSQRAKRDASIEPSA